MESNIQDQKEKRGMPTLPLLLGVLGGVAGALFPVTLLMVPALWAYVMCKWKPGGLALCGGVFAALEILMLGAESGAWLAALAIGMAAALFFMQTKRMSNAYTVAVMAGIGLLCLYALICLPGILSGEGAFAAAEKTIAESAASVRALIESAGAVPAASADTFYKTFDAYAAMLPTLIVPSLTILSGALALGNFLFFRLFARGKGFAISPLRQFRYWSIPRSLTTGLFVMLIGSLTLNMTGWDYAASLSNTVNVIVGMPLLMQGLCVLDFLISKKNDGKVATRRVLTYLVTGLLLTVAQTPLIMLGCFDQLFRFRARATTPSARP